MSARPVVVGAQAWPALGPRAGGGSLGDLFKSELRNVSWIETGIEAAAQA